ncbi:MAG: type pilus assembly ATPase PilB [Moraxellaceae bacterium]|jgi:MSHA biogenesis protein MshE|nr:type pilus assembly ATPase PilB [Moraxellaceae bacterium]
MDDIRQRVRIGDLLLEGGLINEEQLNQALGEQRLTRKKLGRTLIDLKLISEKALLELLSKQLRIPLVNIRNYPLRQELVHRLPEAIARRYRAIILDQRDGAYLVGMSDPLDIHAIDELQRRLGAVINTAVVSESDLLSTIDVQYSRQHEIASIASELEVELTESAYDAAKLAASAADSEAPVARLLQSIFEEAIRSKASDIHIEPDETVLRIRRRIDGALQEQVVNEKRIAAALVLKLKIMSQLDISEKRLPQDGRFSIKVLGKTIDVRLSTLPVPYGESVVLRLLDHSRSLQSLDSVGLPRHILSRLRTFIQRPHGMILVTGPTGSGKTTTLYAALAEINQPSVKIITVEDPIEYRLPRITQVQVNTKIDLSFGRVLRTALRQDPDVLLIGEIRDRETAEIGLRGAITGHLVFSTLHTNDAISSSIRFIDMGIEPYLAASALRAVLSQRLLRQLCDECRLPDTPEAQDTALLQRLTGVDLDGRTLYRGQGCSHCNQTGYYGRIGVHEWLEFNEAMSEALRRNDQQAFVSAARKSPGYVPLLVSAIDLLVAGQTSLAEVMRLIDAD